MSETNALPPWCRVRDAAHDKAMAAWTSRFNDALHAVWADLPLGWGEALEEYATAQQLLTDAGIPVRDPRWVYSDDLDSRVAQHVVPALARLRRIADAHSKEVDEHGGTTGDCNECSWTWPCPTYRWASGEGDPSLGPWEIEDEVSS